MGGGTWTAIQQNLMKASIRLERCDPMKDIDERTIDMDLYGGRADKWEGKESQAN